MSKLSTVMLFLVLVPLHGTFSPPANRYTLTIAEDQLRSIQVTAELRPQGKTLSMDWEAVSFLGEGWAAFVFGLEVAAPDGREIPLEQVGKATWEMRGDVPEIVHLTYEVKIGHDYIRWVEGGHNEAAYVLDSSLFFVGRAVFIAPTNELDAAGYEGMSVEFDIPDSWDVTTTWTKEAGAPHRYRVNGIRDLTTVGVCVGRQARRVIEAEGMEVVLSAATDFADILDVFEEIFVPLVPGALDFFGGPAGDKFALIANIAPQTIIGPYFGGGVLGQTMSLSTAGMPPAPRMPLMNHIVAHEFLHLWNAVGIAPSQAAREYWFSEGFTEYVTLKLLRSLDLIDETQFLHGPMTGILDDIQKYQAVAGRISLREAGLEKQTNYDLVYSGGALIAFALDIELRESTELKVGFEDFFKRMYREFNSDFYAAERTKYGYRDVVRIASELAGKDLSGLFERYVSGSDAIPMEIYMNKLGLEITTDAAGTIGLEPVATPSARQQALRAVILN